MEMPNRVGIMVTRESVDSTWRETVISYARHKDKIHECLEVFDALLSQGMFEPWAALHALDAHGCADMMVGKEMIKKDRTLN